MKPATKILTTFTVTTLIIGGALAYKAHGAGGPPFPRGHGLWAERLAELGVTEEQKARVREILRKHQPTAQPLIRQFVQERRALRDLIHASPVDEAAIRKQTATVADIGADLAVLRAQVAADLRGVLTPEQVEQLHELKEDIDARIDSFLDRISRRVAE